MLSKSIIWFEKNRILVCDGKCNKAWGIDNRPKRQLSKNEDDYEWLSDKELGEAPLDPGTYEGGHAKPIKEIDKLNKWCARECERSEIVNENEDFELLDFNNRIRNIKEEKQ